MHVEADADDAGLWFRNRGREGNWHAEVSVTVSGDEGAVTRLDVDVVGQQIEWEDRLATDVADCLHKMIGALPVVPMPKWPKVGPFPGDLRPGLGDLLNGLVDEAGATVDLRNTRAERLVATMFGLDIADLRRIR